ncbi:hypothetical protein PAXRUDRAFT_43643, partial [Paxillus rubicundulus Ve08.2h10]
HCTESPDSSGTFKKQIFNAAAAHLAPLHTGGTIKAGSHVKSKWTAIKKIYGDIQEYCNVPGAHWDNICGAGIEGEAARDFWKQYIDMHPMICAFKNQGWSFYDMVEAIMPNGAAQG